MKDIIPKLSEIYKKETDARSYYSASIIKEAVTEIKRLRAEVKRWQEICEDERRDHEATIKHTERQLDEFST